MGCRSIPGVRIYGITDPQRAAERCSTLSLRLGNHHPTAIATYLGERGIFTWDGNYYALNLTERLGVESLGGMLRIGLVHYNTMEEVERLLSCPEGVCRLESQLCRAVRVQHVLTAAREAVYAVRL